MVSCPVHIYLLVGTDKVFTHSGSRAHPRNTGHEAVTHWNGTPVHYRAPSIHTFTPGVSYLTQITYSQVFVKWKETREPERNPMQTWGNMRTHSTQVINRGRDQT